ncbi:MAG: trehalase family glycosidase [Bacteroidetes bacterium]|nr:trehalase family glycosidase [Bacteroidota bacterium]
MKIAFLQFFILITFTASSQQLVNIAVPTAVQHRMEMAIQKANALPIPAWCNTPDLKLKRKIVIEKCIKTLYHNYMAPEGDVLYEGIMPSLTIYKGLWSWDSWKHAYALSFIDKELAENSVRSMYIYQNEAGMIADCIFSDKKNNNWRNTKSPLSAWAIYQIYLATKDTAFLKEMYPRMLKYHNWWYADRDHDKNGICEYGSTDGTEQAARWECWDNAIRFDSIQMLKNKADAYSINIESVDLNSYLFLEKEILIKIAKLLNDKVTAKKLTAEKNDLGMKIRKLFFNTSDGFFYDIKISDKSFIYSKEASGWLPLYAGIATKKQAEQVKNIMMNEKMFNTFLPLPVASNDNPRYEADGYWRGPVWLDQFYFGYIGLRKYGYDKEAEALLLKLLENGKNIVNANEASLNEYYNSKTGEGLGTQYFGWTAAHMLLLMIDK